MKNNLLLLVLAVFPLFSSAEKTAGDSTDILLNSGIKHFESGEYKLAQNDLFKCFALRKTAFGQNSAQCEEVLYSLGELFYEAGNIETAELIVQNDLELVQKTSGKNSLNYAKSNELMALIALEKDNYELAENLLQSSNKLFENLAGKNSIAFANNLLNQGQLYATQGYYTAAEALFRQANFISKKQTTENFAFQTKYLVHIGDLYVQLHNYKKAVEVFSELIDLTEKKYGKSHPNISKAQYQLARIFLQSGFIQNAKPNAFAAYEGFVKFYGSKHLKTALAKSNIAVYYNITKQFDKADSIYKEALQQVDQLTESDEKHVLDAKVESGLASLYYSMGKYSQAIELHQRSIEVIKEFLENSHPLYIQTINDLSFLYWASGKQVLAENYFDRSTKNYIEQFNRYFAFLSEQEKGFFYHDIRLFFDKYNSFILASAKKNPMLAIDMYNNQLATKALLFHTSQEIRKQVMQTEDKGLQSKYYDWIGMKEHLSKLYKLVEEDDSEENSIMLDSLEEKTNSLEKEISLRIELNKNKKASTIQDVTWKDIQAKLAPNEAAIEIIRVQNFRPDSGGIFSNKVSYVALIITKATKKHPELIVIEDGKDLETKFLKYYRNSIQHKIKDEFSYLKFWKPIKDSKYLQNTTKLYISCDGVYNQLNLNTLIHPETDKTVFEELDIHLLSNTKDVVRLKTENAVLKTQTSPVLFGYPDYYKSDIKKLDDKTKNVTKDDTRHHVLHRTRGNHDFQDIMRGGQIVSLPGTKVEVEEVSNIFKANNKPVAIYMGEAANEQTLKSIENPSILHIATHGYFMPDVKDEGNATISDTLVFESYSENPLTRSGIMLVGAGHAYSDETLEREFLAVRNAEKFEDGILTAYEAMNINLLNTDMVILSACETGLGEVKNGEGVYGLQRALQTAGAKSIVMSLWKVSDQATKELMVNFYKEWVKTKDRRLAFRTAQSQLKKDFPDPVYWGAFVMIGE